MERTRVFDHIGLRVADVRKSARLYAAFLIDLEGNNVEAAD